MGRHGEPIKLSFKRLYVIATFIIICIACIISLGIVMTLLNYFYKGPITQLVVVITGSLICILSIAIGAMILLKFSGWFSEPIEALDKAVRKVSKGDFDSVIEVKNPKVTHHEIHTELTTLVNNFNLMTKELNRMEYMSRDFMSNVSHEIKTPIATITGITEMILDGGVEEDEKSDYVRMMHESSERISNLCDNMLKVSKLDNQQIIERKDRVRLDEQIRKSAIISLESYPDEERELNLNLEKIEYNCDSNLMTQVWINLIENAIKYSPKDSKIDISLEEEKRESGIDIIKVKIHNQGEFIEPEKLRRMFDRFYQCDLSHKDKGSGLGLSIVSRIIKLHKGNINCTSEENEGITMDIELFK